MTSYSYWGLTMQNKEFQLNDNASFVFQYGNAVYKVNLNIENGLIVLEELHKYQKKQDIKQIISIPYKEVGTEVMTTEGE